MFGFDNNNEQRDGFCVMVGESHKTAPYLPSPSHPSANDVGGIASVGREGAPRVREAHSGTHGPDEVHCENAL
jgi:hypothetical protein